AFGAIADLIERGKVGRIAVGESVRRLAGLPRSAWSTAIAHFGVGVTVMGVVAATAWQTELITTLKPGETAELSGYRLTLTELQDGVAGPNYFADRGSFDILGPDGSQRELHAERRTYVASGTLTTEAAIQTYGFSQ